MTLQQSSQSTTIVERLKEIAHDGEIYAEEQKEATKIYVTPSIKLILVEFVNQNEQSIGAAATITWH